MTDFLRLKLLIFLFLAVLPQYSFGMQKVSGPRPPGHCPSKYFETPLPERAKFDTLKRIIVDYGERNVSNHLRALLDNKVTIRRGFFKFHNSIGYTSLDEIDECTLMYDFLKTRISLTALEKKLNHSVVLEAQRVKEHQANIEEVKREEKRAEEQKRAEETRQVHSCPPQYFKTAISGSADFKKLNNLIDTYGKKKVSDRLYEISNKQSIVRHGDTFSIHFGEPPIDRVDECTMMYNLNQMSMSARDLEKKFENKGRAEGIRENREKRKTEEQKVEKLEEPLLKSRALERRLKRQLIINNNPEHTVFGFELGKPLDLPECSFREKNSFTEDKKDYVHPQDETCFEEAGPLNGYRQPMRTIILGRDESIDGKILYPLEIDGNVVGIDFITNGFSDQGIVLKKLTKKYGKADKIDYEYFQNMYGATHKAIIAKWTKGNLKVSFQGMTNDINSGKVSIELPQATLLKQQWLSDFHNRDPEL